MSMKHRLMPIACVLSGVVSLAVLGCAEPKATDTGGATAAQPPAAQRDDNSEPEQVAEHVSDATPPRRADTDDEQPNDDVLSLPSDSIVLDLPATNGTLATDAASPGYKVAAMVGQVNGQAIYAHTVLEPLHETLRALGQRTLNGELSHQQFRDRAGELIARRVNEIVNDALLLGEAERDLSEQERLYLRYFLDQRRDELIRRHGRGSAAVADRVLRDRTDKGLDETLDELRETELVRRYMRQRLQPRINVTRRDIERYYRDHYDEYNSPATRTLRLIRAADAAGAEEIERRLNEGEPFETVASDGDLNAFQARDGGLMADAPGDDVFGFEPLNEAMQQLDAGEYAGPIDAGGGQWFLKIESIEGGEGQSLKQVQREIDQTLRFQQFRRLSAQYERELYERGSYDSRQKMTAALLEIAANLYAGGK